MREDFLKIIEASRKAIANRPPNILIHGPPKCGKTYLAATASENWKGGEPTSLDDMFWIPFDEGAVETLVKLGVKVPNVVAFQDCLEARGGDVEKAIVLLLSIVKGVVKEKPIRYVVADTITTLDQFLLSEFVDGARDTRRGYGDLLTQHRRFYNGLAQLPVAKIFLCHSKVSAPDEVQARKAKQSRSASMADIQPAISGSARTIYIANVSLEAVLRRVSNGDKITRILYPGGVGHFEGGSRWEGLLDKEELPHLGKLLAKVRAARKERNGS